MTQVPRRGFLTLLASASVFLQTPFRSVKAATQAQPDPACLLALRIINTVQAWHGKKEGVYLSGKELMASEAFRECLNVVRDRADGARLDGNRWARSGELVAGYRLEFREQSATRYSAVLTTIDGNGAYWTDEIGVIGLGTYKREGEQLALSGQPMSKEKLGPARNAFERIVSFIVPTLHAQHDVCCGNCGGFCVPGACSSEICPGGAMCCSLGYQGCTWCCIAGIQYPWQCVANCGMC